MCYQYCELESSPMIFGVIVFYHSNTQDPSVCGDQGCADEDRVLVSPEPGVFDRESREIVPSDSIDRKTLGFGNHPIIPI